MYDFSSLGGKNVLITGGSGAIGQAIARGFSENGAKVFLWGHRDLSIDQIDRCIYSIVELGERREIEKAFKETVELASRIDILVNCAGYTKGMESSQYNFEEWNKTLAINLTAPFILSQLAANNMIGNHIKGSIINITSIGSKLGFPCNPAYGASKGGLSQLAKAFACDWAQYNIRVNNVAPGYTITKMTQKSWESQELRKERTSRTMMGRWADPEEIVGIVLFLASDLSSYITGQDFFVDGGWVTKGL